MYKHASVQICPDHNLCNNAWISKQFGTVVALEEEMVGCLGFHGPVRQYFSLYRAVFQREAERKEKIDERKKCPNNPHPHLLQAQ